MKTIKLIVLLQKVRYWTNSLAFRSNIDPRLSVYPHNLRVCWTY